MSLRATAFRKGRASRAALLFCALALPALPAAADGRDGDAAAIGANHVSEMSAAEAHARALDGRLVLVDIRTPEMWRADGVPEGGFPVDFYDPTFFDQVDLLTDGDRSVPVALICNTGVRTVRAARELAARGYSRVFEVGEGLKGSSRGPGWLAAGLPMTGY